MEKKLPPDAVLKHFGLSGREKGNKQVPCPFHADSNASASINLQKGLLNCFTCGKGWKLDAVAKQLQQAREAHRPVVEAVGAPAPVVADVDLLVLGEEFIRSRGIDPENLPAGINVSVDDTEGSKTYGYLVFDHPHGAVARDLIGGDKERPRYLNSGGQKSLVVLGEDDGRAPVWLVEGMFDALSLYTIGVRPVAPVLGSTLSEQQAYALRGRTVFVALDADLAGFKGAKEMAKMLVEFDANPIVLKFPEELGKDANDALVNDRAGLRAWVDSQLAVFAPSDTAYLAHALEQPEALQVLPTGIPSYDRTLGGGYKDGVHGFGGEPGSGKTTYAVQWSRRSAEAGKRGLYVTYEVSKRQIWSRLASTYDTRGWALIEQQGLHVIEDTTKAKLHDLARNLRVVAGWPIGKIRHVAPEYDFIVIDYLQRMPGPFGENESMHNINLNIAALSDMARDYGKVILVLSSMPRSEYDGITMKSFKGSGNIEYVSQSLTGVQKKDAHGDVLVAKVVKNTRGPFPVTFWLKSDLIHGRMKEAVPGGA